MVKKINWAPGRTFSEFSLLTGYTPKDCRISDIDLTTKLADGLNLKYPLMSAAMTSVTGYDLCLALGKSGGIGVLPVKMSVEEQAGIVKKIKSQGLSFVEEPLTARENETIEDVIRKIEMHGYSTIPVVDRFQSFLGMFIQQKYWESGIPSNEKVTSAMIPFKKMNNKTNICYEPEISIESVKEILNETDEKYMVILDKQKRLSKMAFKKDLEDIKVGSAISTHTGWKKRVEKNLDAKVDLICIDTADAHSYFAEEVIKEYKKNKYKAPLCAGNIITYDGAMCLMEAGADIIKVGMSSGSICTTQREKATGRASVTALLDVVKARDKYYVETGKYVPVVADGGISKSGDMVVSQTIADCSMMGGYFNHFYESAGPKLDNKFEPTTDESKMAYVETWGEGSERARNLDRYGHSQRKTFFAEGEEGRVPYQGRLKPTLERDMTKLKAALSNTGCKNLKEFRDNAVLELNSPNTSMIVSTTHSIEKKDKNNL